MGIIARLSPKILSAKSLLQIGKIETKITENKILEFYFMAPFFMDWVQLPQGYSHVEEAVYFLPFSSQKFLVINHKVSNLKNVLREENFILLF